MCDSFLPPGGNYQDFLAYQKAEVVYDITFRFAHKCLARGDRTIDQMVLKEGGLRERMTRARVEVRKRQG